MSSLFYSTNPILKTPEFVDYLTTNLQAGLLTIDTAGEQVFLYGTLVSQSWSEGTKNITGMQVSYLSVTANANSVVEITLQNISSSGNPIKPEGVPLAIWSGSLTFPASSVVTHTFTSSYTVSPEARLGAVFRYSTFVATSAFNLVTPSNTGIPQNSVGVSTSTNSGSTWSVNSARPPVRFICDDGSVLYFKDAYTGMLTSRNTGVDFNGNSTGTGIDSGDERGILWIPKKTYDITAFKILGRTTNVATSADFILYRDNTVLVSQSMVPSNLITLSSALDYGKVFDTPIRVYPGDNIRITCKPLSTAAGVRTFRYTFENEAEMKLFFGGENAESNISFTNRVDEGAWNTPPSASFSMWPAQIYGVEVVGTELLSGSSSISGSVTLNSEPVEGATVKLVHQDTNTVFTTSSDANGIYQFNNISSSKYHALIEYQSGNQKYNAFSFWNIQS